MQWRGEWVVIGGLRCRVLSNDIHNEIRNALVAYKRHHEEAAIWSKSPEFLHEREQIDKMKRTKNRKTKC